ncbi:MAG: c-type cytochrome biogenesis protein CcsB [Formosimonas sp.]
MRTQPTTPLDLKPQQSTKTASRTARDWIFALVALVFFSYGGLKTLHLMDGYEVAILAGAALACIALAWFWRPLQVVFTLVVGLSLSAVALYQGQLPRGETVFGLKYLLASQPAVMWMSVLFVLATVLYWAHSLLGKPTLAWLASKLTYAAFTIGITALMVRWHESYLIGVDVGHIPVSNLYEVFILFALLTTGFYLYFEQHYQTTQLGGFVMLVVCAAVGFLLWYSAARGAQEIKPLIPALQSWWMKIHVPANFVGYGMFSLAAMVAFAYLIKFIGTPFAALPAALQGTFKHQASQHARYTRYAAFVLWVLGAILFLQPLLLRSNMTADYFAHYWAFYFAIGLVVIGAIILAKQRLARSLPDFAVLDDIMYKSIAIGFVFFTIATILGAMWAADAWGKYWSWDPKETWALIVWLNYAAWLHLRLVAGLRGLISAFWVLVGVLITAFAFLGVNIFLSGLHSYGGL